MHPSSFWVTRVTLLYFSPLECLNLKNWTPLFMRNQLLLFALSYNSFEWRTKNSGIISIFNLVLLPDPRQVYSIGRGADNSEGTTGQGCQCWVGGCGGKESSQGEDQLHWGAGDEGREGETIVDSLFNSNSLFFITFHSILFSIIVAKHLCYVNIGKEFVSLS